MPTGNELPHWKVSYMNRGMEPPMPFGKTYSVVAAESRSAAIAIVKMNRLASDRYLIRASKTDLPVCRQFHYTTLGGC